MALQGQAMHKWAMSRLGKSPSDIGQQRQNA